MSSTVPVKSEPDAFPWLRSQPWLPAVLLVTAVTLCYWNSLSTPFLFDDAGAVVNNPTIRHLASWEVLAPPADGSTTTGRPVVNFSYALNYAVSGGNVWSYHALNVAIHALAALALLGIVRRTLPESVGAQTCCALEDEGRSKSAPLRSDTPWLAFAIALLWAVHPLQTESVVCVAQRTESLCGLFFLLTLYCFVRAQSAIGGSNLWLTLSLLACLLGMATKEVMVTAPLLVLLYDRTFLAGSFGAAWRRHRRFYAALAGTWLLLAWLVWRGSGARGASAGLGLGVSSWTYLMQQCKAIVLYLRLSVWPHPLVLDYGTAIAQSLSEVLWQAIVVLALLGLTIWALIRKPVAGFLGAWFFLILAPSSSVLPLVTQTMAEHRMYLPLAAVIALLVLGLPAWLRRSAPTFPSPFTLPFTFTFTLALAFSLGLMTVVRNRDYRDAVTIWTDTVTNYPQSARAHENLAVALLQLGRSAEADLHFARAVALQPGYVTAHYDWGAALLDQGRVPEAIAELQSAVRLAPEHADARVNLGNALMRAQRPAEAIVHYEAALRLRPAADAHYDLGLALIGSGRAGEAAQEFRAALQLDPNLPEAHYQLARLAGAAGQFADAERHYDETLRLAPDHVAAHAGLGLLLARSGRLEPAAGHFRAVLRLQPANADAHANLGNVLLLQGQVREAIACYENALRLRPADTRFRESLQLARESLRP
ncbi:MAG TPA: tetratricopeptide repeat protein [Opitutaceae bacterium]|nr:tetratricopeptide repeat protein [Opitutaceae bacterium]